jgi:TP901 family phage tail tape measure protein
MAVDVGAAIAYLDLNTSGFKRGFTSAFSDLKTFGDKSKSTETRVAALGQSFTSAGSALTKGLTLPITAVGTAAVLTGNKFESAMSRVKAISGATATEFTALEKQAISLGASTAFSASEAALGMENLASAGFTASEIMAAMPGMMDMAASAGIDLGTASDIAASALRGFGLEASESGHVADVFAKAAADTNAGLTDMGEAMKYIAPVAHAMGMSIEETAAAVGVLSDAGIKGGQAGTTLRGALSRLVKPTEQMSAVVEELGLNFFDTEGNMISMGEIIGQLNEKTQGLTQEQKNFSFATLFGQEALSGMLVLADKGQSDFDALTQSLTDSDGAAQDMAATMRDNTNSSLEELGGSLESAAIAIQKALAPAIKGAADQLAEWANKFVALDKETQKNIISIVALVAAIGPALLIGGKVVTLASNIIKVTNGIKAAYQTAQLQLALYTAAQGVSVVTTGAEAAALTVKEIIVGLVTGKVTLAAAAQWLWNAAMAAFPIGLVVAGVALLTAGVIALIGWLNKETEEQKRLRESTEKVVDANKALLDSMNDTKQAYSDRLTSIEAEAGATQNLADKVFDLAEQENKSTDDKQKLKVMVDMLNQSMGEEILLYDEETGALSKTREQIEGVIAAKKEQIKAQAAQERAVEIAKEMAVAEEQLNSITRQRIELELAKADGVYDGNQGAKRYAEAERELTDAENELNTSVAELSESFDYQTQKVVESTTASEEAAAASQEAAATTAEAWVAANGEIMACEDDMIKKNEELQEAMNTYVGAVTDMFSKINEEAKGTAEEYLATLDNNYEASQRYTENLAILLERGLDEAIVQNWRDKGIESAGEVALWAQATDEEIAALNEKMARNFEQGTQDAAAVMRVGGADVVKGLIDGIAGEIASVQESGRQVADAVANSAKEQLGVHSPSTVFAEIGQNVDEGLAQGIESGAGSVLSAAEQLINDIVQKFSKLPEDTKKHLDDTANAVSSWSTDMQSKSTAGVVKMVSDTSTQFARLPAEVKQKSLDPTLKNVTAWSSEMQQRARAMATQLVNTIAAELRRLPSEFKTIFDQVLSYLSGLDSSFSDAGKNMMQKLLDSMKSGGNDIDAWFQDWSDGIRDMIDDIMSELAGAESAASSSDGGRSAGSHASGLDYVPYDGYRAILHEGEKVMTAQENREGKSGSGGDRTYIFNSPVAVTPAEARRQMIRAEQEMALGFE